MKCSDLTYSVAKMSKCEMKMSSEKEQESLEKKFRFTVLNLSVCKIFICSSYRKDTESGCRLVYESNSDEMLRIYNLRIETCP